MTEILLHNGLVSTVDDDLADYLRQWKWRCQPSGATHYAFRTTTASGRRSVTIWMHRLITRAPHGLVVDHINHNGLDNRRDNLRVVTVAENGWNRRPAAKAEGVILRSSGKWRAFIDHKGRRIDIGDYTERQTADEARAHVLARLRGGAAKPFDHLLLSPTIRTFLRDVESVPLTFTADRALPSPSQSPQHDWSPAAAAALDAVRRRLTQ